MSTYATRLGHALEGLTDWQGAEAAYPAALRLRRDLGAQTLALVLLAGLARLALARGELAAAQALANELAAALEARTIDWVDELLQSLLSGYQVLGAAGDTRPGRVLAAAYALIDRQASQRSDAARRQAFWADVPAQRALLAARAAQEGKY